MDASLLGWIAIGIGAGAVAARLPGRDPGGFIVALLIGIAGAMLGGILGRTAAPQADGIGWIAPAAGAILVLAGYRLLIRRRAG